MCVAPPAASTSPHTPAERAALLAGVEGLIVRIVNEKCPSYLEFDDVAQECRLTLWKLSEGYDPARTPFSGFASRVINRVVRYRTADAGREYGELPTHQLLTQDREHGYEGVAAADADEADPVADAWGEFRRSMTAVGWADVLAVFTPRMRRLVELVAVEGLTVGQVADHLGHPVKAVRRNLQAACEVLARAGRVTPDVADAAGVTADDVARWAVVRERWTNADRAARRELIAECGAGVDTATLADQLGCSAGAVSADRRATKAKAK